MATHDMHALVPMIDKLRRRSPLGAIEVQALMDLPCKLSIHSPGTYLVREGDTSDSCVLIRAGFLIGSKITGAGARQILSIHLCGDLVNLHHDLLGEADYSIQALTRTEVVHIPHKAMGDVAKAHPAIARALYRDALVDGAILREWLLNMGRRTAQQRICHLLCELTLRQEDAGLGKGLSYEWPMTQEQIGDAAGLTGVHVNRTLQYMRKIGLIDTRNRSVRINDWAALQRAGDFNRAYLHQSRISTSLNL